ncbi:MAG: hypothetical protein M0R46_06510 [Candidatus Muirbacterium halophilum]|nr:hypothetical protein [Candidatus Muirbacterium halophilum]
MDNIEKITTTLQGLSTKIMGINRTDGITPIALIGKNKKRMSPGFTPNEAYLSESEIADIQNGSNRNDTWYGVLLDKYRLVDGKYKSLSTQERFERSKSYPNFKDDIPDTYDYYSTRDHYLLFNDSSTDYFRHGLQVIDNINKVRSEKNTKETWDGVEIGIPQRLSDFKNTPYENTDPVIFGFEVIIDAVSSPLLNGSVENFIEQFNSISEIGSRKYVISDFKEQFKKLFKTRGNIYTDPTTEGQYKTAITNTNYTNVESNSNVFETGRKSYMAYYLKKISGLENLIETNGPMKKKYLVDYRNDILKLTFTEDVSLTLGTLTHLYKLLYWSKTNGKYVIPDNLLRFNCDIIISEVRNLNRVRKAIDTGSLEVVKDNVSRHIYSLKECQFYFDMISHDNEIDLSTESKPFDQYTVTMDYKYVTNKFERWVPDEKGFGMYVGYNNGALWKIGNPNSRYVGDNINTGTINDNSVPKFFTFGINSLKQNGVNVPIALQNYTYTIPQSIIDPMDDVTENSKSDESEGAYETSSGVNGNRTAKEKSNFDIFKENSKKAAQKLAINLEKIAMTELNTQINSRMQLINNVVDKIRNTIGVGRMSEPTNIYKVPYVYQGMQNATGLSNEYFSGLHNSLREFAGDAVGDALNGQLSNLFKGGNSTNFF